MTYHYIPSKKRHEHDNYPTPPEAIVPLFSKTTFHGNIYDPCIGEGYLARAMEQCKSCQPCINEIYGTDIRTTNWTNVSIDYLNSPDTIHDNIVTNPPYKLKEQFLEKALKTTRRKVAFLCHITFMESKKRIKFLQDHRLEQIIVITNRLPKMNWQTESWGSGERVAHAWFVWNQDRGIDHPPTQISFTNTKRLEL